jgi:lipopolysaccharide biosynthesis glycosyltransferase
MKKYGPKLPSEDEQIKTGGYGSFSKGCYWSMNKSWKNERMKEHLLGEETGDDLCLPS